MGFLPEGVRDFRFHKGISRDFYEWLTSRHLTDYYYYVQILETPQPSEHTTWKFRQLVVVQTQSGQVVEMLERLLVEGCQSVPIQIQKVDVWRDVCWYRCQWCSQTVHVQTITPAHTACVWKTDEKSINRLLYLVQALVAGTCAGINFAIERNCMRTLTFFLPS